MDNGNYCSILNVMIPMSIFIIQILTHMRFHILAHVIYKIMEIHMQRYSRCIVTERIWTPDQERVIEWNVHDPYDF